MEEKEATFRYKIENFSKLDGTVLSPPIYVCNLPWKIMAMPRSNQVRDGEPMRSLGFFLQCNGDSDSTTWSCNATAELRLIPQEEGNEPLTRKIEHIFCKKENDWGFVKFIAWDEAVNPEKGYLKDDSIILEVWLSANEINETDNYVSICALTVDSFREHEGNDLFDVEEANYKIFEVKPESTLKETLEVIAEEMEYPVTSIRLWPIVSRTKETMRPSSLDFDTEQNRPISEVCKNQNVWSVFLELNEPDSGLQSLPVIDKDNVLLFFKLYDPMKQTVSYSGYAHVSKNNTNIIQILNEKAGYPSNTPLLLYEEVKPNVVKEIEVNDQTINNLVKDLINGDIIIFQRADQNLGPDCELPTVKDYFEHSL